MTVTHSDPTHGRSAFGRVHGQFRGYNLPPGGGFPYPVWKSGGTAETTRTNSTISQIIVTYWEPEPHSALRTIASICVDIAWWPDNCEAISRTTQL